MAAGPPQALSNTDGASGSTGELLKTTDTEAQTPETLIQQI